MHLELVTGDVIEALAGWQVLVAQFNDLVARRLGVSPTETQCLYVLARYGPAIAGEIAKRVNLTSGATTRMLDRLFAAGYVIRTPDPRDRRKVVIEPAGDGIERVAAMYQPLNEELASLLEGFEVTQLQAMTSFTRDAEEVTGRRIRELQTDSKVGRGCSIRLETRVVAQPAKDDRRGGR